VKLLDRLAHFLKELRSKAAMNEADVTSYEFTEAERRHSKGFADAQRWVIRRLTAIMKDQGFCTCDMCVGSELRHGLGRKMLSRRAE
jgi:hypothetical protein